MTKIPIKIDLHLHTQYSYDGFTTIKEALLFAKQRGLDGIAITDHNTIEAAIRAKKMKEDLILIPGIEISAREGHILAIGITQPIKKGLSAIETVEKIHEQDGITIIPHPYDFTSHGVGERVAKTIKADAIEVINSNSLFFSGTKRLAEQLAKKLQKPKTAGSDSHLPQAIGNAYTIIHTESTNNDDILQAIKRGQTTTFGRPTPIKIKLKKLILQLERW